MMKAGFIGFMPFGLDFDQTIEQLKKYRELGYTATEHATFLLKGDVEENKKKLADIGVEALCVGLGMGGTYTDEDIKKVIDQAKKTGVKRAATFAGCVGMHRFGIRPTPPTYDEVMAEIENLNYVAKELAKEGIVTTFHNHDAEFQAFYKGKSAFYTMVDESEYLKFEVDTGWALYGHFDPVKVLKYCGDKLNCIHIKDWTYGNAVQTMTRPGVEVDPNAYQNAMPRFTAPGTGFLPLAAVLEQADEMGMEHAIVEMDFMYHMDQAETLRAAYLNMKETGFVL